MTTKPETSPRTDAAIERLTLIADELEGLPHVTETCREAVAAYRAQAERIKALEGALAPFARAAGKLDGKWSADDWRWNDSVRSAVTVSHIRKALSALNPTGKPRPPLATANFHTFTPSTGEPT